MPELKGKNISDFEEMEIDFNSITYMYVLIFSSGIRLVYEFVMHDCFMDFIYSCFLVVSTLHLGLFTKDVT